MSANLLKTRLVEPALAPTVPAPCAADVLAGVSMREVLGSVDAELAELRRMVERMQTVISPVIQQASVARIEHLQEVQALDLLAQRLEGISGFLAALGPGLPAAWRADVAAAACAVTLSDLSRRLSRGAGTPAVDEAPASDGDLELF